MVDYPIHISKIIKYCCYFHPIVEIFWWNWVSIPPFLTDRNHRSMKSFNSFGSTVSWYIFVKKIKQNISIEALLITSDGPSTSMKWHVLKDFQLVYQWIYIYKCICIYIFMYIYIYIYVLLRHFPPSTWIQIKWIKFSKHLIYTIHNNIINMYKFILNIITKSLIHVNLYTYIYI
jgi:hypothetical protein